MVFDPTKPADLDLVKKSAELIRENFEGLRKDGIVIAKPPLYGTGSPKTSAGENGDLYIDTETGNHYYKNTNGQWDMKYEAVKDVTALRAELSAAKESLLQLAGAFNCYCPYIVGEYKLMSHNELSDGWVKCDGSLYNPQKYPKAFAIYGSEHGGDGVNSFAVPDWRADAIRINDDGRGVDIGRELGSEQGDAVQNITGSFIIRRTAIESTGNITVEKAEGAVEIDTTATGRTTMLNPSTAFTTTNQRVVIDASKSIRTADETRMRNRSCYMYVYIGRPEVDA